MDTNENTKWVLRFEVLKYQNIKYPLNNNNPTIFAIPDYSNRIHTRQAEIWIVNLNFNVTYLVYYFMVNGNFSCNLPHEMKWNGKAKFHGIPYIWFFFFNLLISFLLDVLSLLEWNKSPTTLFPCLKKPTTLTKQKCHNEKRNQRQKQLAFMFLWSSRHFISTSVVQTMYTIAKSPTSQIELCITCSDDQITKY